MRKLKALPRTILATILITLMLGHAGQVLAAPVAGNISIHVTPTELRPADAGIVSVSGTYPLQVQVKFDGQPLDVIWGGSAYYALFALPFDQPVGDYRVDVTVYDPATHQELQEDYTVTVIDFEFPLEQVALPYSMINLLNKELNESENARLAAIYAQTTHPAAWDGPFSHPVPIPVLTSRFGGDRVYNAGMWAQYHTGADYRAGIGDPVLAPANGWVAASDLFDIRGNVVIIDHGNGVFSQAAHLAERLVQAGDYVRRGQLIGMVGSTGRTNGPHLHFEIIVNGQPVDPIRWLSLAPGFVAPPEIRATRPPEAGDDISSGDGTLLPAEPPSEESPPASGD